jgi:predicted ATPase
VQVRHDEGVAIRIDPEPCAVARKGDSEASVGERIGQPWELRAAMSMARLWRDQGKRNEARDLLAPVYGWFTEGFDTLDLREANALLEQLTS